MTEPTNADYEWVQTQDGQWRCVPRRVGMWIKRNTPTGRRSKVKKTGGAFQGVRREN
jgi:hypothetical protein